MKLSVRTFLLINLLLGVVIIFTIVTAWNTFSARAIYQQHADKRLAHTALLLKEIINSNASQVYLQNIQQKIDKIPEITEKHHPGILYPDPELPQLQFQIWDNNTGKILLQYHTPVKTYLPHKKPGLSIRRTKAGKLEHIYVVRDANTTVSVSETYSFIGDKKSFIYHFLVLRILIYCLLALLIWFIINKGMGNINKVTNAIRKKTPNNLDPLSLKTVPKEIKPLVNELNKLLLRLQETLQREKRFTANAAHELKTPLAALKTHAQVALNATQEHERNLALKNIIHSVDRSNHVVQQLLTLNRMIPETMLNETEPVNLKIEAIQVISDLIPAARKEHIEVEFIASKAKPIIMGNTAAIDILLRNLIENAIIYTPNHGTVHVAIEISPSAIILTVTDNGPGIPEELRKRVFERFFRIPGSGVAGSGLGLNIAQQIAHIHNAQIKLATPKSGKGLEVKVIFPNQNIST